MSLLKDWECMTALLLENADDQNEGRWADKLSTFNWGAAIKL